MRTLASLRRARALAALGAAVLVVAVAPAARAETSDDAKAKARKILQQVRVIQERVERAEQAYDRSLAAVAAGVNAAVRSEEVRDRVAARADEAVDALNGRVRSLYMSGGPLALYATLLTSGSITDFQDRVAMVDHVVSSERLIVDANAAVVSQASALVDVTDRVARKRIATERDVAQAAIEVQELLARQQTLLDQANAHVKDLEQREAARAAAAALAAQAAAFDSITAARLDNLHVMTPPALYLSLYHRAAATCPGLSWTVLAAIGQVESAHGSNPSTSYAGAMGPMQFLPATFATYGVDGDHDGAVDIMNPYDAIYGAANYLCANGAGRGPDALATAVWHYNHADWYVQMVLTLAGQYAA